METKLELVPTSVLCKVTHHRGKEIRERRELDDYVLIGLHAYFLMGEAEHFVWTQIDGKRSLDAISKIISEQYSIDYDSAFKEVESFCMQLHEQKLVKLSE